MVMAGEVKVAETVAVTVVVAFPAVSGNIARPAVILNVPFPVSQQLRAALSWPQQKELYVSQGSSTVSATRKVLPLKTQFIVHQELTRISYLCTREDKQCC
jgi:hypothetical protein